MTVKERYNNIIQIIEEKAVDPYMDPQETAEELAIANALIVRDMVAVFNFLTGSTLRAYISERKMMASYKFLIESETRNIEQALEIAGYHDQQTYTKAFKARFGMAPGEAHKKKDASFYAAPLTWEAISSDPNSSMPVEEENPPMPEIMHFGIPEAQYAKAAEAMELEAFYEFTPLISQFAFELSERIGRSVKDSFRFVNSFRDYVEQHSESGEDPDAPEGTLITQEQILHEYGDSEFYQRMFFERGINADTISFFQFERGATEEELLECTPEMLAAYSETYDMSFHFFMRAWRSYMEYTDGKYDPYQFESFVDKLDSWYSIEDSLELMETEWSLDEVMDALHQTFNPRSVKIDRYYDELDETLTRAYTSWDGSSIDQEPDMDNIGYLDDYTSDIDEFSYDEGRPVEELEDWG